jgi:flagellin-specific chaperone FliS
MPSGGKFADIAIEILKKLRLILPYDAGGEIYGKV